jgi:serine/threonine-protein kinase
MLRLRTFGGLTLARGEESLTGAATQRRRLALLALLAVARQAGLSRDKVQGILWPESDAARARHSLNQLLYAQRRQFDSESLFSGQKTLRLNPAVIWTDIGAFEDALDRGEPEAAVGLYRGPFLDGFFLGDAAEFEQWAEAQKERLARRVLEVTTSVARSEAARENHARAVVWWRRASELDPMDAVVALGLVQALADAGDRPGALRQAQRYQEGLRGKLGIEVDERMRGLMEKLR